VIEAEKEYHRSISEEWSKQVISVLCLGHNMLTDGDRG